MSWHNIMGSAPHFRPKQAELPAVVVPPSSLLLPDNDRHGI